MEKSLDQPGQVPTWTQHRARATQNPPRLNAPKHLKAAEREQWPAPLQEGDAHSALPLPSAQGWGISVTHGNVIL